MTLGHSDGFRIDGVTHRATQAMAFCKRFVGHREPLSTLSGVMERLLYLGDLIQTCELPPRAPSGRFRCIADNGERWCGMQMQRMTLSRLFGENQFTEVLVLTLRKKADRKLVNIQKLVWVFNALFADPLDF